MKPACQICWYDLEQNFTKTGIQPKVPWNSPSLGFRNLLTGQWLSHLVVRGAASNAPFGLVPLKNDNVEDFAVNKNRCRFKRPDGLLHVEKRSQESVAMVLPSQKGSDGAFGTYCSILLSCCCSPPHARTILSSHAPLNHHPRVTTVRCTCSWWPACRCPALC